jgi:uncharacterized membrane protein
MRRTTVVFVASATAAALVATVSVEARAQSDSRRHHGGSHHRHYARGQVVHGAPGYDRRAGTYPPGYNFGGPHYSTCDGINADRMLVGTCR